jgi:hypothetical protein
LHCPLLLFLMELTQSSLSPSPEKPPPKFYNKIIFQKHNLFFSHPNFIIKYFFQEFFFLKF